MTTNTATTARPTNIRLGRLAARPVRTRRLLERWAASEPIWAGADPATIAQCLTARGSWPLLASLARLTQAGDPDAPVWLAAALATHPAVTRLALSTPVDDVVQSVILGLLESNRSITGIRSILDCARTTRRQGQRWTERTTPLPHHPTTVSAPDLYAVIDLRVSLDPQVCRTVEAKAQGYTAAETGTHRWTIHRQLARARRSLADPSTTDQSLTDPSGTDQSLTDPSGTDQALAGSSPTEQSVRDLPTAA